jgi:hypothetical protein
MEDCDRGKTERRIARAERIVARQTERLAKLNQEDFKARSDSEALLAYRNILRDLLRGILLLNRVSELSRVLPPVQPTQPVIEAPDEQRGARKAMRHRPRPIISNINPFADFDRERAAIPRQAGQPTPTEAVARSASIDAQIATLDRLKRARMAASAAKTISGRKRTIAP